MTKFRIFPHSGDSVEPQAPGIIVYTWSDEELSSQRYFYSEIEAAADYLMTAIEKKFDQKMGKLQSYHGSNDAEPSQQNQRYPDAADDRDSSPPDQTNEESEQES